MDYIGFFKLYRKMLAWEWYGNINTKIVFIHLLLSVNWVDKKWQGIIVERGQLVSTPDKIAKELGLSLQQVKTAIKNLKRTNEITSKGTNKFTVYTVTNYDLYQNYNTDNNQQKYDQITNEQPTNDKRTTTTKEKKELKNTTSVIHLDAGQVEKRKSANYQPILDCWKRERENYGLKTGYIGKKSENGAVELASAIDKGETTLNDVRKAIQNLLADHEKRDNYSLSGLANNFEIWLNRSQTKKDKTIQPNQTNEVDYYSGVCEECGYSMTGFNEGFTTCQRCKTKIKLRKEDNGR